MIDWNEYKRWLDQAKATLRSIKADIEYGSYNWACFKAHQAVEYALKALLRGAGRPAFGHDLIRLYTELKGFCGSNEKVKEYLMVLSKYYIPPRYPDAFPEGASYSYYTRNEAERAYELAFTVIDWVERCAGGVKKADRGEAEG